MKANTKSKTIENKSQDIIDISLNSIKRKKYRINEDNNKILELDTADFNIISRLQEAYPQLIDCTESITKLEVNSEDVDGETKVLKSLKTIENKMRELVDYIFDSNVCEICLGKSCIYNLRDGRFMFDIIIDTLYQLYEDGIASEMNRVHSQMASHTEKYTKKK